VTRGDVIISTGCEMGIVFGVVAVKKSLGCVNGDTAAGERVSGDGLLDDGG